MKREGHPSDPSGSEIDEVPLTTPEQLWPLTGLFRLLGSVTASETWGPGGAAWPDQPWWQLSGLFDLTFDQSVLHGVAVLESAMADHATDPLVI